MPKRRREEPCHICGHHHDFENGEPCSICGHRQAPPEPKAQAAGAFPAEIIPGFLYLGSYDNAARSEILKTLGVTHILNTVPNCQALYKNSFEYHTVNSTPPDFQECFQFLDHVQQQENKRVMVFCMSGASRSPAVVMGYLMHARHLRLADSYKHVQERRPTAKLSDGDAERLQQLELQLFNCSSTDAMPEGGSEQACWHQQIYQSGPRQLPIASLSFNQSFAAGGPLQPAQHG
ncbi:hypothetical protein WJX74_008654 [Apatococcus lobatus]|uniref:Protein-tyrosine-phosphatase n=2 Tax=Apatococcus TaxID=904362 RepID=A0AAW1T7M9_9CHLO